MKLKASVTVLADASDYHLQQGAQSVDVQSKSAELYEACFAQSLSKVKRALLIKTLKDMGYNALDTSDVEWIMAVRSDAPAAARIKTQYSGNPLLNRLVFAINARFGSKGFIVDSDGNVAVLVRHPSPNLRTMMVDMAAVIEDARLTKRKGFVQYVDEHPVWHCTMERAPLNPAGMRPPFVRQKYRVDIHAVADENGPCIYIEWGAAK